MDPRMRTARSALVLLACFLAGLAVVFSLGTRRPAPPPSAAVSNEAFARVAAHMASAEEHLAAHRLTAAYQDAKAAEVLAPRDAEVQLMLGNIAYQALWKEAAEVHYRRSAALDPGLTSAHANLALVLLDMGQSREAGDAAQRALFANPGHPFYGALLGRSLLQRGRPREAVPLLQNAVDNGILLAQAYLGRAQDLLGDSAAALQAFDAALARNPTDAQAHYWRSACLKRLGRHEESGKALAEYKKHLALSRDIARIREVLLVRDPDDVELRLSLVRLLSQQGSTREASAALERAEALRPGDPEVRRLRVRLGRVEPTRP
jgi:tetratricopeptide (TPR) repeat protein